MFRTYVQHDPYSPLIAFGHRVATLSKALERAKKRSADLQVAACVRDESLPFRASLREYFEKGVPTIGTR